MRTAAHPNPDGADWPTTRKTGPVVNMVPEWESAVLR